MIRRGLKEKLIAHVAAHPEATASEIAAALDCRPEYVNATARRQGLSIRRERNRAPAGQSKAKARQASKPARVSVPNVRIKTFTGTDEQYDAIARLVPLVDLGPSDCKWPVGDPKDGGFGFCGHRRSEGSSYCAHHHRRSLGPGTEMERSAARALRRLA